MNCRLQIGRLGIVLVMCGLWPAAASAQLIAPPERAQIEYGPVSVYPSLQIVEAGKDSNVFSDSQNPRDDYTFTVASRALVVTKLGANELMFSTGSDYVWFRTYKEERSSNGLYAMRFNLSASRFKPFIGAQRVRTRARPTPEIDARALRLERMATAGANFNLTERTAITASATASDSSYAAGETFRGVSLQGELDKRERAYASGVRYAVTPLTTVAVQATYTASVFPDHLRNAKTYGLAPAVEFSPDAGIRGRFSAGLQRFEPDDRQWKEYTGLVYSGGVNWTLWSRTGFEVDAQRNISDSYKEAEPFYLLTSARVSISQKLIGPLDVTGSAERQFLSYRFRSGRVAGEDFVPDKAVRNLVSAGVGITLGRGFKLVISGERTVRTAPSDPEGSFKRTRLLSTITTGS